jgi:type IV pilus biogenesis protein PilP
MRTLFVFFAAFGVLCSGAASASSTLNDVANMQLSLEKAEYEKKLSELRRGAAGQGGGAVVVGAGATTTVADSAPVNPVLKGVYGVGKRLYAIVDMGGTEVEFGTGDTYFGYRALSINTLETVLTKLDSKGRNTGKLYRLRLTGAGDMSAVRNLPPLPSVPGLPEAMGEPVKLSAPARTTPANKSGKK